MTDPIAKGYTDIHALTPQQVLDRCTRIAEVTANANKTRVWQLACQQVMNNILSAFGQLKSDYFEKDYGP